jgi:enamine deaminase RidA (YjgF/YER057c/UK114 family)
VHQEVVPAEIGAPAANYAHAILVTDPTRWLHTAGVVPTDPDGRVPDGVPAQAERIWRNIGAILAEAQMGPEDVVSVTTYVVADAMSDGLRQAMAARDAFLGGRRAASTLVTVPRLAQPAWLLEIQVIAAR